MRWVLGGIGLSFSDGVWGKEPKSSSFLDILRSCDGITVRDPLGLAHKHYKLARYPISKLIVNAKAECRQYKEYVHAIAIKVQD